VLSKLRSRLTFANVVSVLALFVALGGTSYAAIKITGKNVKDSSLTGKDIKNSSLTSSDVKNRSLLSTDFKTGQLPAGPRGADGTNGTNGFGTLAYALRETADPIASGDPASGGTTPCPAGTFPTGGDATAYDNTSGDPVDGVVTDQGVDFTGATPDGWFANWNNTSGHEVVVDVEAVCANASTIVPDAKRSRARQHIKLLK
jgi:hypothetical protein